jgi:hypothetical protein
MTTNLLDTAIEAVREVLDCDRRGALEHLSNQIDRKGAYTVAKLHEVLVNNSAEEFMIEFMTAYNNEVGHKY